MQRHVLSHDYYTYMYYKYYSRDEVDSSHYPVFHQMEGVKLFQAQDYDGNELTDQEQVQFIEQDLKRSLEGMALALFGNVVRHA